MNTKGDELAQLSKTWNPRKWLEVRREIKKFSEKGFNMYILTMVLYATYMNLYLILTKNIGKIKAHQATTLSIRFFRGYYSDFRYK